MRQKIILRKNKLKRDVNYFNFVINFHTNKEIRDKAVELEKNIK